METKIITLGGINIIGKAGLCTKESNIAQDLWRQANAGFGEIAHLAKKKEDCTLQGLWGAMSDVSMQFLPWENDFSTGLYLAGVEVRPDAQAPDGWTKWTLPTRTYLAVKIENQQYMQAFRYGLDSALPQHQLVLCGAVCEYTNPSEGATWLMYPCRKED